VSVQYPLVPVPCSHCRATRTAGDVRHQSHCPSDGGNRAFFSHPDLMDLESHITAFYPEA
jgi:hypothetical protein